eukprot:c19146_g1_i2.p1 GENE.c19146_g1_i2~~c19146_g1_i2.p1  ORF type:complete len:270 (+),score=64.67 c19146_g1_i2:63-812(+)
MIKIAEQLCDGTLCFIEVAQTIIKQKEFWKKVYQILLPTLGLVLIVWIFEAFCRLCFSGILTFVDYFFFDVSVVLSNHQIQPQTYLVSTILNILPMIHLTYLRLYQPQIIQDLFCFGVSVYNPKLEKIVKESPFPSLMEMTKSGLIRILKIGWKLLLLAIFSIPMIGNLPRLGLYMYMVFSTFDIKFSIFILTLLVILRFILTWKFDTISALQNSIGILLASTAFLREILDPFLCRKLIDNQAKKNFLK